MKKYIVDCHIIDGHCKITVDADDIKDAERLATSWIYNENVPKMLYKGKASISFIEDEDNNIYEIDGPTIGFNIEYNYKEEE